MSDGPYYCDSCQRRFNIQLIYSTRQLSNMFNVPVKVIHRWMNEGKLKFRYRLLSGNSLRRVVDYIQLWDYVHQYLPTPADLESPHLNKTQEAISRIIEWHRKGAATSRAIREKKRAEREATQPDHHPPEAA